MNETAMDESKMKALLKAAIIEVSVLANSPLFEPERVINGHAALIPPANLHNTEVRNVELIVIGGHNSRLFYRQRMLQHQY